jgi:putative FmdB family regulatory protein
MPLYEYQCDACAHRFEVIQKYSDAPIDTCPKCAGSVKKLFSSPAIQFKGSGFYITDYARSGSKGDSGSGSSTSNSESGKSESGKSEGASSSSESKSESKGETKTETKTEGKTETKPTGPASS